MRPVKRLFLLTTLLGFSLIVRSQSDLLWHIKSPQGGPPNYLLGTFHVAQHLPQATDSIVHVLAKTSKGLVVEMDLTDSAANRMEQVVKLSRMTDTTLLALLGRTWFDKITFTLQERTGYGPGFFDAHKPMLAALLLSNDMLNGGNGMEQGYSMDLSIQHLFNENNKPIIGLENAQQQAGYLFNDIPLNEQVDLLKEAYSTMNQPSDLLQLKDWYAQQQLDSICSLSQTLPPVGKKVLLDARNGKWMETLPELIKSGGYLIAVGAMHLCGDDGLIAQLRKAGYSVIPIE